MSIFSISPYTLLLPFAAVVCGYLIALLLKPKAKRTIKLIMAFSGAFLLALIVFHILPEVYESKNHNIGLYIMVGILFQIVLEFFSKGAEHGHVHGHEVMSHIPWTLFISLCIHGFLEGMPISNHHELAFGVAIHHFPIAIILTMFLINSRLQRMSILIFMGIFALVTPFGTIISESIIALNVYQYEISAIVVGILFHISSTIIFESSENHKFNLAKITVIVLGVFVAYIL